MNSPRILIAFYLLLLAGFIMHGACEKRQEGQHDSTVEINLIRTDFISTQAATFMAQIEGDLSSVKSTGIVWGQLPLPVWSENHVEAVFVQDRFALRIHPLEAQQTYFARAYAILETGKTIYSNQHTFTTTTGVKDLDGNSYEEVQIGAQHWLGENLRVGRFNNDDAIGNGSGKGNYGQEQRPLYYFEYGDDPTNAQPLGRLYTWYVVNDSRGLCPAGWRIPALNDWIRLAMHLDPNATHDFEISRQAGGMLKSTGLLHSQTGYWREPNSGASNITGMRIVPAGVRDPSGAFDGLGYNSGFWTATDAGEEQAHMVYVHFLNSGLYTNQYGKYTGYAVRCIRRE